VFVTDTIKIIISLQTVQIHKIISLCRVFIIRHVTSTDIFPNIKINIAK